MILTLLALHTTEVQIKKHQVSLSFLHTCNILRPSLHIGALRLRPACKCTPPWPGTSCGERKHWSPQILLPFPPSSARTSPATH